MDVMEYLDYKVQVLQDFVMYNDYETTFIRIPAGIYFFKSTGSDIEKAELDLYDVLGKSSNINFSVFKKGIAPKQFFKLMRKDEMATAPPSKKIIVTVKKEFPIISVTDRCVLIKPGRYESRHNCGADVVPLLDYDSNENTFNVRFFLNLKGVSDFFEVEEVEDKKSVKEFLSKIINDIKDFKDSL